MKRRKDLQIFCSYAHEDQEFAHTLQKHFATLKRLKSWAIWTAMEIHAGEERDAVIREHLERAHIILCLVSSDFIGSDYCYSYEMMRAMERHENGEAYVLPILVRPVACFEDTPLGKFQVLPADGTSIIDHDDPKTRDRIYVHVIEKIVHAIDKFFGENQRDVMSVALAQVESAQTFTTAPSLPVPQPSAHFPGQERALQSERGGTRLFGHQEDAYDFLYELIRHYGVKEAVFLQYSCQTSMPLLRKLLRMRAKVTVFIQHEETAAKIGSQFQADRIIRTTRTLRSDLGDVLVEPHKLKVYKYYPPCSMSAIKIDNRILYMGWYTYEQKVSAVEEEYPNDTIDISGHDRAAMVIWKGTHDFCSPDGIASILNETNDFQKLEDTFNVLVQNYRDYAEPVSI